MTGWDDRAACRDQPTEMFFPEEPVLDQTAYEPALSICAGCPVRFECLDDALTWPADMDFGVRGGLTADDRQGLRRQLRDLSTGHPGHGTPAGYTWERRHLGETCQACRDAEARYRDGTRKVTLARDDPRHGTRRGYRLGCRKGSPTPCPAAPSCSDVEKEYQDRIDGKRPAPTCENRFSQPPAPPEGDRPDMVRPRRYLPE